MNLLENQRAADVPAGIYQDLEEQLMANIIRHCRNYKQPIDTDKWLMQKLAEIAAEKGAQKLIVGLPVNMDGSYGFRCDACRELGKMLQETSGIEVDYQDERLTTVIAHDFLSANNVKGKKRKEKVDAVSAVLILQSYIDKNK